MCITRVLSVALLFSTQVAVADSPPSTPTGLAASAYSDTTGEVRWYRSHDEEGVVVGYEVTRDGQVLGVWDALSVVDTDLSAGTDYLYGVTAIDNAGQRSETSTVVLSTVFAATGLTAAVYSSTAAEIFWDRAVTRGLRYEVYRDGDKVGDTDGTSWFDSSLESGTSYVFELVTYDSTGRRSDPVAISLTTRGDQLVSTLASPQNLTSSVYSATAVEIFWDRVATAGLLYEVQRDNVVLDTISGTSWFDDSLLAGTDYNFEVVAIDANGNRSEPASLALTTRSGNELVDTPVNDNPFAEADPDAQTVVARLGYPAVRETVDDLVSMSYLSLYYDNESDMLSVLSEGPYYDAFELECPGGGTVSGLKTPPSSFEGDFDACVFNGITMTGHLDRITKFTVFGLGGNRTYTITFDDFSVDAGDAGSLVVSGTSTRYGGTFGITVCGGAAETTASVSNDLSSAVWKTADGTTTVDNARLAQSEVATPVPSGEDYVSDCYTETVLSFEGDATLQSDMIGQQTAVMEKQGDIVSDTSDEPMMSTEAQLAADFGDDSTLAVTAISDTQVQVDIVADGVSVSFNDDYVFEARDDFPGVYD